MRRSKRHGETGQPAVEESHDSNETNDEHRRSPTSDRKRKMKEVKVVTKRLGSRSSDRGKKGGGAKSFAPPFAKEEKAATKQGGLPVESDPHFHIALHKVTEEVSERSRNHTGESHDEQDVSPSANKKSIEATELAAAHKAGADGNTHTAMDSGLAKTVHTEEATMTCSPDRDGTSEGMSEVAIDGIVSTATFCSNMPLLRENDCRGSSEAACEAACDSLGSQTQQEREGGMCAAGPAETAPDCSAEDLPVKGTPRGESGTENGLQEEVHILKSASGDHLMEVTSTAAEGNLGLSPGSIKEQSNPRQAVCRASANTKPSSVQSKPAMHMLKEIASDLRAICAVPLPDTSNSTQLDSSAVGSSPQNTSLSTACSVLVPEEAAVDGRSLDTSAGEGCHAQSQVMSQKPSSFLGPCLADLSPGQLGPEQLSSSADTADHHTGVHTSTHADGGTSLVSKTGGEHGNETSETSDMVSAECSVQHADDSLESVPCDTAAAPADADDAMCQEAISSLEAERSPVSAHNNTGDQQNKAVGIASGIANKITAASLPVVGSETSPARCVPPGDTVPKEAMLVAAVPCTAATQVSQPVVDVGDSSKTTIAYSKPHRKIMPIQSQPACVEPASEDPLSPSEAKRSNLPSSYSSDSIATPVPSYQSKLSALVEDITELNGIVMSAYRRLEAIKRRHMSKMRSTPAQRKARQYTPYP